MPTALVINTLVMSHKAEEVGGGMGHRDKEKGEGPWKMARSWWR